MGLDYGKARFVTSAAAAEQFPTPTLPEVAFVGRSNVGKSSLLNMLTHQKNLAKVSKTPGRTQLVNFFSIDDRAHLVDLPGYGFADVPKSVQAKWDRLMHDYLSMRQQLLGLVLLLDVRRTPSAHDYMMLDWIGARELPVLIVLTKVDKVGKNEAFNQLHKIARIINVPAKQFVRTSILSRDGQQALRESLDDLFDDYFAIQTQIDLAMKAQLPKRDTEEEHPENDADT